MDPNLAGLLGGHDSTQLLAFLRDTLAEVWPRACVERAETRSLSDS